MFETATPSTSTTSPTFIVFEGLDGSGKSTLAKRTAAACGAHYMTTPSPSLRQLRARILDELGPQQEARQLFYLSTVFAASAQIRALLGRGESVVLDRYFLSTQAYAEFRGSSLELDTLGSLLTPAHMTVYVDAPLELRRQRIYERGASPADRETLTPVADRRLRALHMRRRSLELLGEVVLIDSERYSIDECVEQILSARPRV